MNETPKTNPEVQHPDYLEAETFKRLERERDEARDAHAQLVKAYCVATEALRDQSADVERLLADYLHACCTVQAMHAAATGSNDGPARGVVEDVAELRSEVERLRALLNETLVTMRHASVFVRSREQMHQTGVRFWDENVAAIDAALAQDTQCFCDAKGIGEPGVTCGDCPRDYKRRSDAALAPREGGR